MVGYIVFQNFAVVVLQFPQRQGAMLKTTICKFISHKSASESLIGLVQSLNSPFFPPHKGAEPGRAKEESRITCMRMLRPPPFSPQNRQSRSQSFVPLDQRLENESSGSIHFEITMGNNRILVIRFTAQSQSASISWYGAYLKWLLPELSFSDRWSRGTKLWERDCKIGGKPYLEVFSRFVLWRDFLNDKIHTYAVSRK